MKIENIVETRLLEICIADEQPPIVDIYSPDTYPGDGFFLLPDKNLVSVCGGAVFSCGIYPDLALMDKPVLTDLEPELIEQAPRSEASIVALSESGFLKALAVAQKPELISEVI